MAKAIIYKGYLSDTEAEHFERLNPGWTVKNCDVLCFTDDSGTSTEYVIFTGPDRKSTSLNSSHVKRYRMPSSA